MMTFEKLISELTREWFGEKISSFGTETERVYPDRTRVFVYSVKSDSGREFQILWHRYGGLWTVSIKDIGTGEEKWKDFEVKPWRKSRNSVCSR